MSQLSHSKAEHQLNMRYSLSESYMGIFFIGEIFERQNNVTKVLTRMDFKIIEAGERTIIKSKLRSVDGVYRYEVYQY